MDNQNKEINETIKRTKRYWYVDGFSEIGIGLLLVAIILFNYAAGQVRQTWLQIGLFVIGLPALIILGGRGMSWILSRLKEKYTYPRTGYVAYHRKTSSQRWKRVLQSGIIGATIGAGMSIFAETLPVILQYTFIALVIALAYTYIGYTVGLARFYVIAAATMALLIIILVFNPSSNTFYLLFFTGQGFFWITSGTVTLYKYMRTTQPSGENEP
jgi:MFS family permease